MKNIRFEFNCTRDVPFYAHLCNQYLQNDQYDVTIGKNDNLYYIEAKGEQAQLETLADAIANDFLISTWLVKPQITAIDIPIGTRKLLETTELDLEYCQHCQPQLGDNQAAHFGEIDFKCPCCMAHTRISADEQAISLADAKALVTKLDKLGSIELPVGNNGVAVIISFQPIENQPIESRQQLVCCNPNNLHAHFCVSDNQVLALSSIEKPFIKARPISSHTRLKQPIYEICFAKSRLLLVICEILRQQGIDYVYIANSQNPKMALVEAKWSLIDTPLSTQKFVINAIRQPLHDDAQAGHYQASWRANHIEIIADRHSVQQANTVAPINNAAKCALHAALITDTKPKNIAALYFSNTSKTQIVTLDGKQQLELFFEFPSLPDNGYDIVHHLELSPQKTLLDKFKAQYPEDYLKLLSLKLTQPTDNIESLWAIAAIFLGASTQTNQTRALSKTELCDFVVARAMCHKGANAPRVDFPLTRGEAFRSLNWCKTLGSIISFKIAEEENIDKLAFGMHDSFADYICNWIEHLDQNICIKSVVIAGNSFANEVLAQRVALRLGKNFSLNSNPQMDLDGLNIAAGALYLKQRRH
ncbi:MULTISPECIES: NiFe hydrogenase [unclassified Shewanella]|uniref:NiFe hydrogenase n=1 Tax=unclassified Shewanella TaxID=196818 RepID=UPI001BC2D76E|nr:MULTISPECIES: NiFe hydrogenase [unclassified Shewanella]GIU11084.1 NiFe hydrogenase assembly chaperone HyaE [Shewanella sp. MBTL60-112-B1]GIU39929.1 NiFe hydrogenase assembly chaperone HyaE [Shewanella sp. MBTL60-112-B2]